MPKLKQLKKKLKKLLPPLLLNMMLPRKQH
jgi:hypothetical protein